MSEQMNLPQMRAVTGVRRFGTLRTVAALVLREMSTTYGRTPGGYIWAVAEPVGGIVLLTIIFSIGFRDPPIGTNFAIFYATGLVPFLYYSDLSGKVAQSITFSRPLLAYPAVTFLDAVLARIITNVVTNLMVAYIVLAGIYLFMDTRTDPQMPQIALSLAMSTVLGAGIGTLNCYLFSSFPVWAKIWGILMRPMFILACVIFPFASVPQPYRDWLWWNPLIHIVGQMREGFYPSYDGSYIDPAYVFAIGLVTGMAGLALLLRYHRDLLNR